MRGANAAAAGSVGNLGAQFNDIGMMLAAGQSPLLLALQQGTQISQVLGPAGAKGAVSLLGGAFLSMLNPVNLATIAIIYFGATAVQALFDVGEEAQTVEDRLKSLKDSGQAYAASVEALNVPLDKLISKFGGVADAVRDLQVAQAELDRAQNVAALEGAVNALADRAVQNLPGLLSPEGVAASLALLDQLIAKRDALAAAAVQEGPGSAAAAEVRELSAAISTLDRVRAGVDQLAESFGGTREEAQALALAAADLFNAEGPQAQVTAAAALRESFVEIFGSIEAADAATGGLVEALLEAEQAGANLAATDMASPIGAAADEAARLADNLAYAAGLEYGKIMNTGESGPDAARRSVWALNTVDTTGRLTSGAGGVWKTPRAGGGGGAAAEANDVERLVEQLRAELEVLRETDPLKKAMLGHREALAEATAAERAEVEGLEAALLREKAAIEASTFAAESMGNALIDALMGGKDAGEQLIQTLMRAVLQAAILGTGPLAGLFGGTGLVNMILGIPSFDGGGYTGAGPRTGGIDGRGGYIAVVHPGETVIDHHSAPAVGRPGAAAAAGGRDDRLHVSLSPDLEARVVETARQESISITRRALTEYDGKVLPRSVARVQRDPGRIG